MRQVTSSRVRDNRADMFKVVTTILDASIGGGQIGDLYERRWSGEVGHPLDQIDDADGRPAGASAPEMVHGDIRPTSWRTTVAAENGLEPRQVSFKGAKQAVTAFAPKLEAARPKARPALIDALLAVIAYHRVGDRPGRWEPRAKRRPGRVPAWMQPRADACDSNLGFRPIRTALDDQQGWAEGGNGCSAVLLRDGGRGRHIGPPGGRRRARHFPPTIRARRRRGHVRQRGLGLVDRRRHLHPGRASAPARPHVRQPRGPAAIVADREAPSIGVNGKGRCLKGTTA